MITMASMGGGTFTVQNKIIPGAYINFVSRAGAAQLGTRGVVALPLALDWGPEGRAFSVAAAEFNTAALPVLGHDPTAPALRLIRAALGRAKTLVGYRVNGGGVKAGATVGGLPVTARWSGTRGNDLRVALLADPDDETRVVVETYLDRAKVDAQTVSATDAGGLVANDFVTFGAAGTLTPTAATPLTGGTNGSATGQTYAAALAALELESWNVIGYPGTDESVKALVAAFVKRLRDDEGRKVVGVLHQLSGDSIGLIDVANGVLLADGTTLPGHEAVCWVAGASAAAEVNQSLTNTAYDGAVDVDLRYTKTQLEDAIKAGRFVFYADNGKARVLTDINSLTTFGGGVSHDWTSNRVVRVMDGWANDVARLFGESYQGRVTNSDTGRQLLRADLVSLGEQYQSIDAISGFVSEDVSVAQGDLKRDVVCDCALTPNDAMEKLYMTVTVN